MPTVHRRTLLSSLATAAGVAGLAGLADACTSTHSTSGTARRHSAAKPDPQLADLADEHHLLDVYDATIAAHPDLAARLAPLRSHHADHVAALGRVVGSAAGGVPSPAASAPVTLPTLDPSVPVDATDALAALREAERTATAARTRSCVSARPDRAALLGSLAACEASHEVLLT